MRLTLEHCIMIERDSRIVFPNNIQDTILYRLLINSETFAVPFFTRISDRTWKVHDGTQ